MDISIKAALVAAIVTVILGIALDIFRVWWRERRNKRRVRQLVSLEVDHNFKLLDAFWNQILQVEPSTVKADFQILPEVRKVLGLPLPPWAHKIWESQLQSVAAALKEGELEQVHFVHTQLDAITNVRDQLLRLDAQFEIAKATSSDIADPKIWGFYHNGPALLEEIRRIVNELKNLGNSLAR